MTISFQERGEHLVVRHGREREREREREQGKERGEEGGQRGSPVKVSRIKSREQPWEKQPTYGDDDRRFCIRWRSTREGGREAGREHVWIYGRIEICAQPAYHPPQPPLNMPSNLSPRLKSLSLTGSMLRCFHSTGLGEKAGARLR